MTKHKIRSVPGTEAESGGGNYTVLVAGTTLHAFAQASRLLRIYSGDLDGSSQVGLYGQVDPKRNQVLALTDRE